MTTGQRPIDFTVLMCREMPLNGAVSDRLITLHSRRPDNSLMATTWRHRMTTYGFPASASDGVSFRRARWRQGKFTVWQRGREVKRRVKGGFVSILCLLALFKCNVVDSGTCRVRWRHGHQFPRCYLARRLTFVCFDFSVGYTTMFKHRVKTHFRMSSPGLRRLRL